MQVVIKDETMWATQKAMAQLFGVGVPAISKHLSHIFGEGELDKEVVVSKMEITTQHGTIVGKTQSKEADFYNLDAIIAVCYSVYSLKATRFRRYALLPDKGSISREQADKKAEEEYRLFNPSQQIDSDFDKHIRGLLD